VTSTELLDKYLRLTTEALARVTPSVPGRSFLQGAAQDFLTMARAYLADAEHFKSKGDLERALASVSYAHGWLDAGVRLGILNGGEDDARFTFFQ
jgi:uncharacterized protein